MATSNSAGTSTRKTKPNQLEIRDFEKLYREARQFRRGFHAVRPSNKQSLEDQLVKRYEDKKNENLHQYDEEVRKLTIKNHRNEIQYWISYDKIGNLAKKTNG